MIKYRVKGNFLSENRKYQEICSEYFTDDKNVFAARKKAYNYFNSFIKLLVEDFKIDFNKTFQNETSIIVNNETIDLKFNYGLAIQFTFDEIEFYEIDYFGIYDSNFYDAIALGLSMEMEFYKESKFDIENPKTITYCNKQEWEEGYTEDEPTTFDILETSFDFSDKSDAYWWLTFKEKEDLIKEKDLIKSSFKQGENSFVEYKPALLYNFKTNSASIGVKNIIAKVICSFLNSNGGILFIGVNNEGEIVGLDDDFSLSNKEDKFDFFRLEFENLLFQFFDKSVYNYIIADFNFDYEKPFFSIKVKPSDVPFFLLNKRDEKKEFYIRTITSSVLIEDLQELVNYCLIHWNKN
ncbi:Putative DNA-binding domain-containing protein [Halpernia humi]|uniref:Putative DNA-binding domain-containing protein n=1 Tax=Halpernia humi TaxID=493375 RepID=A0A1H5U4A3_9FLAO|nr:ATP-binding protein [Halpernia humi]SEF69925.1 Putative DNA-binding domain-containing protein [Halpernia humi]